MQDQPQVELSIRVALGYVYMENSLLPQAEKELRRAETLARQTGDKEMLASTLESLSNVLFHEAQSRAVPHGGAGIRRKDKHQQSLPEFARHYPFRGRAVARFLSSTLPMSSGFYARRLTLAAATLVPKSNPSPTCPAPGPVPPLRESV